VENYVVIDSDFCNMIAPGDNVTREKELFSNICKSLGVTPVIHTFVLNEELLTNKAIKELVSEQFIKVFEYTDFLTDEIFISQYTDTFVDFYKFMNGVDIEKKFETITKHNSQKNMGEIHSLILAQYMNIPIFMSNDGGAKTLAAVKINTQAYKIIVKNVCDIFCDIKKKGVKIERKVVKAILKQRDNWLEIYDAI